MNTLMKKCLLALLVAFMPLWGQAAGNGLQLDRAPDRSHDLPGLQHGAKVFVNYCLNCHGASALRYNNLLALGLSEQQIQENLMFTAEKPGELMAVAARAQEAKQWFGVAPPDLSVIARARASEFGSGADWLYTYLRTFYRDPSTATGWNNVAFPTVAMPHVLWELQGEQVMGADHKLHLVKPGTLTPQEYDDMVANLVGFMVWMAEPVAQFRQSLGVAVLIGLLVLLVFAFALKREYWKDVH
jgi:ubiquinol-cytochrome c reductase cytochrome c1 subunit